MHTLDPFAEHELLPIPWNKFKSRVAEISQICPHMAASLCLQKIAPRDLRAERFFKATYTFVPCDILVSRGDALDASSTDYVFPELLR